jgi:hypothetical protein
MAQLPLTSDSIHLFHPNVIPKYLEGTHYYTALLDSVALHKATSRKLGPSNESSLINACLLLSFFFFVKWRKNFVKLLNESKLARVYEGKLNDT